MLRSYEAKDQSVQETERFLQQKYKEKTSKVFTDQRKCIL